MSIVLKQFLNKKLTMMNNIYCQLGIFKCFSFLRREAMTSILPILFLSLILSFSSKDLEAQNNGVIVLNTAPTAKCKAPETMPSFHLDVNCRITITPDDIDDGSADAETAAEDLIKSISPSTFNKTGMYEATLTVVDEEGLTDQCKTTIRVVDNMPPTITCENHTVSLVNG